MMFTSRKKLVQCRDVAVASGAAQQTREKNNSSEDKKKIVCSLVLFNGDVSL